MRCPPTLVMLAFAFSVILSGCIAPNPVAPEREETDTTALEAVDDLAMGAADRIALDLEGSGWARLEVNATQDITLKIRIEHDTIDDLTLFSDEGEGIYDEKNHTMVYLYHEDERPIFSGYSFEWWGTPDWAIWPSSSTDWDEPDSIDLSQGEQGVLLVANNVPGYMITLSTGSTREKDSENRTWHFMDHPGHHLFVPEPDDEATVQHDLARLQRERNWTAEAADVPPSILFTRAWTYVESVTVRAGATSDTNQAIPQDECAEESSSVFDGLVFPTWSATTGGYQRSAFTGGQITDQTCDYRFERALTEHYAGPENVVEGAAYLTIPHEKPDF